MKKLSIYLDTSVIGGCCDIEFETDSIKILELIELGIYDGVISDITINELLNAPAEVSVIFDKIKDKLQVLVLSDEVVNLSQNYLENNIITERFKEDTLHIAFATVHEVDVLVSWNFKHIVNLNKIKQFNSVNLSQGYKILEIRSPKELLYE